MYWQVRCNWIKKNLEIPEGVQTTLNNKKIMECENMQVPKELYQTFLSAEDIKDGAIAIIKGEGEVKEGKFGSKLVIPVEINGEVSLLSLNTTSNRNLVTVFGTDTKNWLNKKISLSVITMLIEKKEKKVIIANTAK